MQSKVVLAGAFFIIALAPFLLAAPLSCSFTTSCDANSATILRVENNTGGYLNSHGQLNNFSGTAYAYDLCCATDVAGELNASCSNSSTIPILQLSGTSNAHVETTDYSNYPYDVCMGSAVDNTRCVYVNGTCPDTFTGIMSLASTEGDNATNAHIGNYSDYLFSVCCHVNSLPTIASVILNSSAGGNTSSENLTAYPQTIADTDGDDVFLNYDWRVDGTSLAVLNMNFDVYDSAGTGQTKDYTTFGNNGSISSGAFWNSTGGYNSSGAYEFDGTDSDYIDIGLTDLDVAEPLTITFWVKPTTIEAGSRFITGDITPCAAGGGNIQIYQSGSEIIGSNCGNAGAATNTGTSSLSADEWYHVAYISHNDSYRQIFLNGESKENNTATTTADTDFPYIGARRISSDAHFNGTIDEFIIWNKALSPEQILALYNNRTDLIDAEETSTGESWRTCVTPNDRKDDGITTCSNSLSLSGSPPSVGSVILNATDNPLNSTDANLTAYPQSINDPDGDNVTLNYDWRVDGTSVAVLNMNFDVNNSAGTGLTRDYSSYGTNGSVVGATTVTGYQGNTLSFDGVDDYVNLSSEYITDLLDFTIEFALKVNEQPPAEQVIIVHDRENGDSSPNAHFQLSIRNDGTLQYFWESSSGTNRNAQYADYWSDHASNWTHVTMRQYSNGTGQLIVNDVIRASATGSMNSGFADDLMIGAKRTAATSGETLFFNGSVDELRIWNRSLSDEQITALYNNRTDLIVSQETSANEQWQACVVPNDGEADGSQVCSNTLTIANSAPALDSVIVNSTFGTNKSNENLTAYPQSLSDSDGDTTFTNYDWRVNDTSIALLNMNFDVNNSAGSGVTRDYSTFGNNGTINSSLWYSSLGINNSGVYNFTGTTQYIDTQKSLLQNSQAFTVLAWVFPDPGNSGIDLFVGAWSTASDKEFLLRKNTVNLQCYVRASGDVGGNVGFTISNNEWALVACRYNGTHLSGFKNGVEGATTYTASGAVDLNSDTHIGGGEGSSEGDYEGLIDNVLIFNRSLSDEQILALYNNRTDLIVSQETSKGENWTACVTPNDGYDDGSTVCSLGLEILNVAPEIDNLVVNSTHGTNSTKQNLTAYPTTSDGDGDTVRNAYDWRLNGTSVAVVNFNFDVDNSAGTDETRDYSSFRNNGSIVGDVTYNRTAGLNGSGAYEFPGTGTQHILPPSNIINTYFSTADFTISTWFKSSDSDWQAIYWSRQGLSASEAGITMSLQSDRIRFAYGNGSTGTPTIESSQTLTDGLWHHAVVTMNRSGNFTLYIDGQFNDTAAGILGDITGTATGKIGNSHFENRPLNGSLDNFAIWNGTLSPEQILALYNNRRDLIVSQETTVGDNWTACVTPNDGYADGSTSCSSGLLIVDSIPTTPTLLYPADNNNSVAERNITLNWTDIVDIDGDTITYNLSLNVTPGSCAVEHQETGIPQSNYTTDELCSDQTYNWSVQACDIDGCSPWATQFNFTIASTLGIELVQNTTYFGSLLGGENNNTESGGASPMIVENTGNVVVDVTLNATGPLFTTVTLNDSSFQFKIGENETGAYAGGQTTYLNITSAHQTALDNLSYIDAQDAAYIHYNVTVPQDEPPATLSTTIIVQAVSA